MCSHDEYEEALEKLRAALAAPSLVLSPSQHKLIARLKAGRAANSHPYQHYHYEMSRRGASAERKAASKLRRSTSRGAGTHLFDMSDNLGLL